MQTLFKKLEGHILGGSTKIENAIFPYKTSLSEVNVKTNRMWSTKEPYHKERSLVIAPLFFRKFCFSWEACIKSWLDLPTTQTSVFILFESVEVLF